MPFEHLVDHESLLVVVRGAGEGSLEETYDSTYRLLKDPSIGSGYRFMFVIDDIALNPTHEEMSEIVSLISSLRSCFNGRMAIVAARKLLRTWLQSRRIVRPGWFNPSLMKIVHGHGFSPTRRHLRSWGCFLRQ